MKANEKSICGAFASALRLPLLLAATALTQLPGYAHTVSLSASNAAPNSCSARVVAASVSGGSGDYTYFWTSDPVSTVDLGDGPSITVSPEVVTTYTVAVRDNGNNQFATASIVVGRVLQGPFSVTIPNAFTPNGDGINDVWEVLDGGGGTGPLNAYRYELTIRNASNQTVYSRSETLTSGTEGWVGGDIGWNGRVNGTGSIVPGGFYQYSLRLYNCSGNQLYQATLFVLGVPSATAVLVYPNPAADQVQVMYAEAENVATYEIVIRDKNGVPVINNQTTGQVSTIDVQALQEGAYFISIYASQNFHTSPLIIER